MSGNHKGALESKILLFCKARFDAVCHSLSAKKKEEAYGHIEESGSDNALQKAFAYTVAFLEMADSIHCTSGSVNDTVASFHFHKQVMDVGFLSYAFAPFYFYAAQEGLNTEAMWRRLGWCLKCGRGDFCFPSFEDMALRPSLFMRIQSSEISGKTCIKGGSENGTWKPDMECLHWVMERLSPHGALLFNAIEKNDILMEIEGRDTPGKLLLFRAHLYANPNNAIYAQAWRDNRLALTEAVKKDYDATFQSSPYPYLDALTKIDGLSFTYISFLRTLEILNARKEIFIKEREIKLGVPATFQILHDGVFRELWATYVVDTPLFFQDTRDEVTIMVMRTLLRWNYSAPDKLFRRLMPMQRQVTPALSQPPPAIVQDDLGDFDQDDARLEAFDAVPPQGQQSEKEERQQPLQQQHQQQQQQQRAFHKQQQQQLAFHHQQQALQQQQQLDLYQQQRDIINQRQQQQKPQKKQQKQQQASATPKAQSPRDRLRASLSAREAAAVNVIASGSDAEPKKKGEVPLPTPNQASIRKMRVIPRHYPPQGHYNPNIDTVGVIVDPANYDAFWDRMMHARRRLLQSSLGEALAPAYIEASDMPAIRKAFYYTIETLALQGSVRITRRLAHPGINVRDQRPTEFIVNTTHSKEVTGWMNAFFVISTTQFDFAELRETLFNHWVAMLGWGMDMGHFRITFSNMSGPSTILRNQYADLDDPRIGLYVMPLPGMFQDDICFTSLDKELYTGRYTCSAVGPLSRVWYYTLADSQNIQSWILHQNHAAALIRLSWDSNYLANLQGTNRSSITPSTMIATPDGEPRSASTKRTPYSSVATADGDHGSTSTKRRSTSKSQDPVAAAEKYYTKGGAGTGYAATMHAGGGVVDDGGYAAGGGVVDDGGYAAGGGVVDDGGYAAGGGFVGEDVLADTDLDFLWDTDPAVGLDLNTDPAGGLDLHYKEKSDDDASDGEPGQSPNSLFARQTP